MFTRRIIVAVVIAGLAGALANAVAAAAALGLPFLPLVVAPGRILGAMAFALLLPPIFATTSNAPAWALAIAALMVIPTALAKMAFTVEPSWGIVAALNLVYAVAAVLAFRAATPDEDAAEGRADPWTPRGTGRLPRR